MAYTVLGSPISPFVRKVMVSMADKGGPYEHEDVNPRMRPAPGTPCLSGQYAFQLIDSDPATRLVGRLANRIRSPTPA